MKGSLIIVGLFVIGVVLGINIDSLKVVAESDISRYILYFMMFTVGIGIGSDKSSLSSLRAQGKSVLLVPVGTIIGTLIGGLIIYPLIASVALHDVMAISCGFGYYSLSSILLTDFSGAEIGTIALMTNIFRELITILSAPLMVRFFGRLAPISSAGAASIDTLLPIISRTSGSSFVIIAIAHGLVMELAVPILVTLFAGL